jgi:hypothetical protein
MLPTKFRFIWPCGFRGEELKKSANQKQESPVAVMFANGSGRNEHSLQKTFYRCFRPSFGSFGQTVSEENIFKIRTNRNKNCLWRPCLLMDRDEMSNLYRGPSIDASYLRTTDDGRRTTDDGRRTTDDGRRTPSDGKSLHCLWQGELKRTKGKTTIYKTYT